MLVCKCVEVVLEWIELGHYLFYLLFADEALFRLHGRYLLVEVRHVITVACKLRLERRLELHASAITQKISYFLFQKLLDVDVTKEGMSYYVIHASLCS